MGRDVTADTTPLLNNAEQNIGNSEVVRPQDGTATILPQTNPQRIIMLTGGSAVGQTTTVTMTAARLLPGPENPNPGLAGPITGVVEFGSGARSTRVEFDVPCGPYIGYVSQASNATEPQDGGTMVTVPTSVIRAYARYDNLLIAPVLNTTPPQSLAQLFGLPFFGPGGPTGFPLVPPQPMLVKAMAAYFTRPRSKAYKTVYLYVANLSGPQPINVNVRQFFCLPAFTKTLKVLRQPLASAVNIVLHDGIRIVDQINVLGNAACPTIDIIGQECVVGIQSPLNADSYTFLALVCEIAI